MSKKFNCDQCEKSFGHKSNLNKHVKTVHLKQKNFKCEHCEKSFGQKGHLKVHIKTIHLNQKNFHCDQCDISFGQKGNLKAHNTSVHLNQKNFHCDHCDYSCGRKGNLNKHVKTIHLKQKTFKCEHCDYSCGEKGNLNRHVETIHLNPNPKNMSRGEKKVYDILEELDLEYKLDFTQEKTFSDLKGYNDGYLRYDFCINLNVDEEDYLLIEYDGRQHFKKVKWQNNMTDEEVDEKFKLTKRHDRIKNKYARLHAYPLLRIKYNDKNVFEKVKEFIADYSNGQFF
jgi:hypothetical protein